MRSECTGLRGDRWSLYRVYPKWYTITEISEETRGRSSENGSPEEREWASRAGVQSKGGMKEKGDG